MTAQPEIGGSVRVKIDGERLNLKIIKLDPLWGRIGIFEYNITEMQNLINKGKLEPDDFAVIEYLEKDHGYEPIELIRDIKNYVHYVKIGNKNVYLIINYSDKLWTCRVLCYYPNPDTKEVGGRFHSLQEYIDEQIRILNENEKKYRYSEYQYPPYNPK